MPVLFVHGVAVREPDDPQFATVQRFTGGVAMADVLAQLGEHLGPVLRPSAPHDVTVEAVYWGDLGMTPPPTSDLAPASTPDEIAEVVEAGLLDQLPESLWPDAIRAVWNTVRLGDPPPAGTDPLEWYAAAATARLVANSPGLERRGARLAAHLRGRPRRVVIDVMSAARGPVAEFVPIFVGDVLRYVAGRGLPHAPGPITARVIDALDRGHDLAVRHDEPFVVVTHSMGGQLVYDALTAFAGERRWQVDLWCASGPQLGIFAQLGVFLEDDVPESPSISDRVGYLWNVWSASDVLSFPAEGYVAGAHDTDFGFVKGVTASHLAYLSSPEFFRTLAAKVEVHTR